MIDAAWFLYCTAVALLLYLAGLAGEAALRAARRPVRWVWTAAVAGTFALPLAAWSGVLRRLLPQSFGGSGEEPTLIEITIGAVVAGVPAMQPDAAAPAAGGVRELVERALDAAAPIFSIGWLGLSALLLVVVLAALIRLRRLKSGWRDDVIDGERVLVSRRVGPAVVGLVSGTIVVPQWTLSLEQRMRRLMLLHEKEHLLAGDLRLSAMGLCALVLMPWNVPLWWQVRRLRAAVELDCDSRVLRSEPDPRSYGMLLLEVGRRRSGIRALAVGLTEPRSSLERRIRMLTRHGSRPRRLAALTLGALAAVLALGPCWMEEPSSPISGGTEEIAAAGTQPGTRGAGSSADTPPAPGELAERLPAVIRPDRGPGAVAGLAGFVPPSTPQSPGVPLEPSFTPFTSSPKLADPDGVREAIESAYPAFLRDAAGRTIYWLYVDENGRPQNWQVHTSSGYEELDAIMGYIFNGIQFEPARNMDRPVGVWIELPVSFMVPGAQREGSTASGGGSGDSQEAPVPQQSVISAAAVGVGASPEPAPVTELPRLQNASEVQRAIREAYPVRLRIAGVSGQAVYRIFVDENGSPRDYQVVAPSGNQELDGIMDRVWRVMEFSPAMSGEVPVATWVEVPITYEAGIPTATAMTDPANTALQRLRTIATPLSRVSTAPTPVRNVAPRTAGDVAASAFDLEPLIPTVESLMDGPVITSVTVPPELINTFQLQRAIRESYPPRLRFAGIEGRAVFWLLIDERGQVVQTAVRTSSGHADLDQLGIETLRRAEFEPARVQDRAVPVWVELPVAFGAG
ncbi:MAG TPA: M56 family metallopeptidase [Longimicrobiales bacterium]|nr:M56 family metallopeptidase [Longimicrobiales bacterium]